VCWNSSVEMEGWRQWEISPCVRAGDCSGDGCCGIYTRLREGKSTSVVRVGKGRRLGGPVVVLGHVTEHGQEPA